MLIKKKKWKHSRFSIFTVTAFCRFCAIVLVNLLHRNDFSKVISKFLENLQFIYRYFRSFVWHKTKKKCRREKFWNALFCLSTFIYFNFRPSIDSFIWLGNIVNGLSNRLFASLWMSFPFSHHRQKSFAYITCYTSLLVPA